MMGPRQMHEAIASQMAKDGIGTAQPSGCCDVRRELLQALKDVLEEWEHDPVWEARKRRGRAAQFHNNAGVVDARAVIAKAEAVARFKWEAKP